MRMLIPSIFLLLMGLCISATTVFSQEATPFTYAKNVQVESFDTHRIITIQNINRHSTDAYQYALVPKGDPLPNIPNDAILVRTPVTRAIIMTTVFVGYLDALDALDSIIGIATPEFVNNPEVRAHLEADKLKTVQTGPALDIEDLLLLKPELILTSSSGNASFDVHPQLTRAGLPVVLSAGYMEAHPLARSEWIKFVAEFYDKRAEADAIFSKIEERYNAQVAQSQMMTERPTVFSGAPYSGSWFVPGGQSYMARAIADAGGDYLWSETHNKGGIPLDFERVFLKASQADIWINTSSYRDLSSLFSSDKRFRLFEAAKTGAVFNNNRQLNDYGGNNIWERGIVYPDEVLSDLIKIFHPELRRDVPFFFYKQLQ